MPHPALALILAGTLLTLVFALFWPRKGLVPLLLHAVRRGERESIEDALKHLYDCEYHDSLATLPSLAGSLGRSASRVATLIARLEATGLIRTEETGLRLSAAGRSYALRIIRAHRLWETYLADRTGFDEADWHSEADRREHQTSAAQLQQMVRLTGNPRFDPHGDPIPTAEGEVLACRGRPLTELAAGVVATIVHVEDEPEAIYAQLRAQNIRVQHRLTVLEKSPERIRVDLDGEEQVMAPIVAANIWVVPQPSEKPAGPIDRLSRLRIGETRRVVGISPLCQGLQRRRLLDLGLVPGTEVTAVMASPSGDPIGYRICGAVIALRRQQADLVQIQGVSSGEATS